MVCVFFNTLLNEPKAREEAKKNCYRAGILLLLLGFFVLSLLHTDYGMYIIVEKIQLFIAYNDPEMIKVAAKATIAYSSGKTAKTIVLPNTS